MSNIIIRTYDISGSDLSNQSVARVFMNLLGLETNENSDYDVIVDSESESDEETINSINETQNNSNVNESQSQLLEQPANQNVSSNVNPQENMQYLINAMQILEQSSQLQLNNEYRRQLAILINNIVISYNENIIEYQRNINNLIQLVSYNVSLSGALGMQEQSIRNSFMNYPQIQNTSMNNQSNNMSNIQENAQRRLDRQSQPNQNMQTQQQQTQINNTRERLLNMINNLSRNSNNISVNNLFNSNQRTNNMGLNMRRSNMSASSSSPLTSNMSGSAGILNQRASMLPDMVNIYLRYNGYPDVFSIISQDEARNRRAFTTEDVNRLTTLVPYNTNMGETRCPISLEDFEQGDIVRKINRCGHIFKENILKEWLMASPLHICCPICRCDLR